MGQHMISLHYLERQAIKNLLIVYFWDFPYNIFVSWVTETVESETVGKGGLLHWDPQSGGPTRVTNLNLSA